MTHKFTPLTSPVLLFFFGLTLYLNNAWVPGMFFDGHLYMTLGKHASDLGYWFIPHFSKSTHPEFSLHLPFVFILEGLFFKLFGSSYTAGRIFSALFSMGCFIILYLWARKKSEAQTFWSCFFFLIIPPLIKKTRFPGLDTPLMFFCLLSAWLTFCYLTEESQAKRLKLAIGAGLAWGCALLTKGPIAFFVPCGVLFYLAIMRQKNVFFITTHTSTKNYDKSKVSAHNLGQIEGKQAGATEACSLHVARSDSAVNPQDGLKCEYLLFFDFKTYLIPIIGLAIFSTWPLGLWMMGKSEIAQQYFISVFIDTALKGRGEAYTDFFFYIFYLVKQTFFIFPLALMGIWATWKQKCPVGSYACALFLALIIPMSMMSFKYSHYIIPGYPYLALLAGMGITSYAPKNWLRQFENKIFPILAILLFSLLSIFPITNRSGRDPQLQRIASLTEGLKRPPRWWALVNQAYPFYHAANFMAYRYSAEVFDVREAIFQKILSEEDVSHLLESQWPQEFNPREWALLVKSEDWNREKQKNFVVIAHFKRGDFLFVVHKSLLQESFLRFD